jgi:hypothetical protein
MEGRITTLPTTPGVHKGARQSKAQRQCETRHSAPKVLECVDNTAFRTMQPSGHPANGYGESATARHGRMRTWMPTDKKG